MTKLLSQILKKKKNQVVTVDGQEIKDLEDINNIPISSLVFDSREVKKDSLFFALPGTHVDGNLYIPQAIKNGANAVVYQGNLSKDLQKEIAKVIVERAIDNEIDAYGIEKEKFAPVLNISVT